MQLIDISKSFIVQYTGYLTKLSNIIIKVICRNKALKVRRSKRSFERLGKGQITLS